MEFDYLRFLDDNSFTVVGVHSLIKTSLFTVAWGLLVFVASQNAELPCMLLIQARLCQTPLR